MRAVTQAATLVVESGAISNLAVHTVLMTDVPLMYGLSICTIV